jgi:GT2 family glycosyltransferase
VIGDPNEVPLASLVMLNLNGIDYIEEVLNAVFAQTVRDRLQVIAVDQGSTDGSRELIQQRFGDRLELIRNTTNIGTSAGNNQAVRRARGRYILRLDSDAVPTPMWAEELLSAAESDSTLGMCTSKILMYDDRTRIDCAGHNMWPDGLNRSRGNGELDTGQYDSPVETLLASGCASVYRRDAFVHAEGFDEDFVIYGDDTELGMRLRLQGWRCLYVPTAVVHHLGGRGIGAASLDKVFLVERNRIWVMLKTFPMTWILASPWYTARRLAGGWLTSRRREGIASRVASSNPVWRVVLTILWAWWAGLRGAPKMLIKRRVIMATNALDARQIAGLLRRFRATAAEMRFG